MKTIYCIIAGGLALMFSFNANAQHRRSEQQIEIDSLLEQKPSDKELIHAKLKKLTQSKDEREWQIAVDYYNKLGDGHIVDSLQNAELQHFPDGLLARDYSAKEFYKIKNGDSLELAFQAFMKRFPSQKFSSGRRGDNITYDYMRYNLASFFAKNGDADKAQRYLKNLQESFWKPNAYSGVANIFLANKNLPLAEKYARMAVDTTLPFAEGGNGDGPESKFAAVGLPGAVAQVADILAREGKQKEALKYIEKSLPYIVDKDRNISLSKTSAYLLLSQGRNQEAYKLYDELLRAGRSESDIRSNMEKAYLALNKGDEKSFDDYWNKEMNDLHTALRDSLSRSTLKEQAPMFTLSDINGKQISLKDYQGKVIILDFWATWCGPCKASFPAMQMTINKYRNDPNVAFLFIHTWESSKDPVADVRDFLKDKNYTFEILFDIKDKTTHQNKVVKSYGVDGIPAKFVIDPNGFIRFRLKGFDSGNEAAVDELSAMIELAKAKG